MAGREILTRPAPAADLRLNYGDGPLQFMDFRFPARQSAPPALVVYFHGGFWRNRFDLLHAGNVCAPLTGAGMLTANVEYRRVGDEGGGYSGTLDDALAALRFARRRAAGFGSDGRTLAIGHSAGGHLALWLAGEVPDLTGAIGLGPVACLREAFDLNLGDGAVRDFLGGTPEERPEVYRAACPAGRPSAVPRVLIHGAADQIVPLSISQAYVRQRQGDPAPVRLVELPDADHFDIIDPLSPALGALMEAVTVLLRVDKSGN